MRKLLRCVLFLLLMIVAVSAEAKKQKGGYQKVYCFGFASSFTDSLAYLTDVQELDSAYIMPNGFIADRQLYSLQLYAHVNDKRGVENPTTAFFFSTKAKPLAKKYQKVKKLYMQESNLQLVIMGRDEFMFKPEEYVETLVTETVEDQPAEEEAAKNESPAATNGKKAGKSKKKEGRKQ